MSITRNIAKKLFGKSIEILDLEIKFHKEANAYGSHGALRACNRDLKLSNAAVRFVFIGTTIPPVMTPRIMDYIWEEARSQGYLPHELISYGTILNSTMSTVQSVSQIPQHAHHAAKIGNVG